MDIPSKFFTGALPSPKDDRDYQFSSLGGAAPVVPYHSDTTDIIVNQLTSSQCGPCAITAARYETEHLQNGNDRPLSHTWVYGNDEDCYDEGMYLRTLMKIACSGIPYATAWESWGTKGECRGLVRHNSTPELKEEARKLRGSGYYACSNWAEVCNAARVTNGAVVILMQVFSNWYLVKKDGVLPPNSGQYLGNHFVRVKDYEILADGSFTLRCQNSWGTGYGDNGYIYINSKQHHFMEASAVVDNINEVRRKLKFPDVADDRWSAEAINWCVDNGIIAGFEDGTFKPDEPLTREQMAFILYKFTQHFNIG